MNNNNPNENHEYHSNDSDKEFEYYKKLVECNENADSIEYLKFAYSEEEEMLTGNRQKILPKLFANILRSWECSRTPPQTI